MKPGSRIRAICAKMSSSGDCLSAGGVAAKKPRDDWPETLSSWTGLHNTSQARIDHDHRNRAD
jgi:hypothetical protein